MLPASSGWRSSPTERRRREAGTRLGRAHHPSCLHPTPPLVHEFTSRGHQAGFTTGQQKHVIRSRTPYLGAYVGGNQVHVPVISIIHHKLCKGAIDAQTTASHKSSTHIKKQMSSYFVNSFCGRYPNGPDYQLHNYGDHSSVSEQFRDSASMHSGRYGYGYNGMDLSVGRSGSGHFGSGERARSYAAGASAAPAEPRYSQPATSTHSPPPDPLPCSAVAPSPGSDSHHGGKNSLGNSSGASANAGSTHISSREGVGTASGAEEDAPASSEQASAQSEPSPAPPAQPQIYPWMRKLHISHGKASLFLNPRGRGGAALDPPLSFTAPFPHLSPGLVSPSQPCGAFPHRSPLPSSFPLLFSTAPCARLGRRWGTEGGPLAKQV
uniref:Homeobox A5 n=1 Tax=Rousettus aegyptiacus TaxID=9407 RepID=A0A7J8D5X1_ROUAE|nr:homeobox A5 [Rousettus aegyptiacus]